MSAAVFIGDMTGAKDWQALPVLRQMLTKLARYMLSGLLLSLSARAEAPAPSQEFWNYFVEFGDAQGELFDPSDFAEIAKLPAKVKAAQEAEMEKATTAAQSEQVPHASRATQE